MHKIPLTGFILAVLTLLNPTPLLADDKIEFNRDIRPILSDNCFACHGPDARKRKAKLRLDDRAVAIAQGAIVPGKSSESELVVRIMAHADDDSLMPPKESNKNLTDKQKTLLKKWIDQGAEYQAHWAYIPMVRPKIPADVFQPIDYFIRSELKKLGITPSPMADRHTLIRRVYLDLIGLPPTPEEVESFVNDRSPNAFEKVVDHLLASPHYGERMATPWLDLVRFADTVGYHGDQNQRIFPYREYVIQAFNQNMPFDRFTREQLAGDLLPNPTSAQLVASGFNRLNMMTREGGAQPKEYLTKYQADRVRTVSMTWLGSTIGCAECHDHKFDPFTAKDFYSLSAFFADIRQWGVYSDYNYTPNPDLRGWSNDHPFPPEIEVESPYLKKRIQDLEKQLISLAANPSDLNAWKKQLESIAGKPLQQWNGWLPCAIEGKTEPNGSIIFHGPAKKGDSHSLILNPKANSIASIRVELLPCDEHADSITRNNRAASVNLGITRKSADGKDTKVPVAHVFADRFEVTRYRSTEPVLDLSSGWRTPADHLDKVHTAVVTLEKPIELKTGEKLTLTVTSDNVGSVRVSTSPLALNLPSETLPDTESGWAVAQLLVSSEQKMQFERARAIRKEILNLNQGKTWTQVTVSQQAMPTRVLVRGNWMDESGAIVEPAIPGFLSNTPASSKKRLSRLDLADWITSPKNPLTARVFVNRLWKQLFGNGISNVLEDFGAQGEPPSHPELLDWLALEFASDWDIKRILKLMVMSETYRQSSRNRPELRDVDPSNRLLAFQNPRRLDAEFVRDNILAISGLLNRDIGGPSSKPYQPEGYYSNLQFPNRVYEADKDQEQYRRGLYTHWQRTFLHPMLANFDAPSREESVCSRTVANTPQQALTLLNDPSFVEAARALAARLLKESATDDDRLTRLYQLALARQPKPEERESLVRFLTGQRKHFSMQVSAAKKLVSIGIAPVPKSLDPAELAAWTSVCRVILNLHETVTRY